MTRANGCFVGEKRHPSGCTSPARGVGNAPAKCINRVAPYLTRNDERGSGLTHGLRCFESKVFSAYDPGATIKRTNGPLFNGLLRRLHPAVPRIGLPNPSYSQTLASRGNTPVGHGRRVILRTFYEKDGPRKQGIGMNPTM